MGISMFEIDKKVEAFWPILKTTSEAHHSINELDKMLVSQLNNVLSHPTYQLQKPVWLFLIWVCSKKSYFFYMLKKVVYKLILYLNSYNRGAGVLLKG